MTDWTLIDREERIALTNYARLFGLEADEFARQKLETLRAALDIFNRNQRGIGGKEISLSISNVLSPVDALIELGRNRAQETVRYFGALMRRHIGSYGALYSIDIESLWASAMRAGVDVEADGWLERFIAKISVVVPFSPNIDAFVNLFDDQAPKVVVSGSLYDIFDVVIVPTLLNILSEDGRAFPLKRRVVTPDLAESAMAAVLAGVDAYAKLDHRALKFYLDPMSREHWILRRSEVVDTIGALICFGAQNFIFLHELAHILLGHHGKDPMRDEIEADNLALNCLIQNAREGGEGGDLVSSFAVAGALLVFRFFELLDACNRLVPSDSHPPALWRRAAVSLVAYDALRDAPLVNLQGINEASHLIFSKGVTKDESPSGVQQVQLSLDEFHLVAIPLVGDAHIFQIKRKQDAEGA